MEAYLNEYTSEYWRGDEDRTRAADYVSRLPMESMSAPIQYAGRIGGRAETDQAALKQLRAEILAEVYAETPESDNL